MITLAEHKLNLFRQIDQMPEELLIELEQLIINLWQKKKSETKQLTELEIFLTPRIKSAEQGKVINKSVLDIFNEVHQEEA
jgi:hypothetical protein